MKNNFVTTQNVRNLSGALSRVHNLNRKTNRMALVYGEPGLGKTEAVVQYIAANPHAIFIRAKALVSPRWFLSDIVRELGEEPMYRANALFDQAVAQLDQNPRLLIVDESDYLLRDNRCIETLRDLHDTTPCSVCIVGMSLLDRKLAQYRHLFDRFAEIVKFQELTLADIRSVAAANCEVKLSDSACVLLHKTSARFRQVMKNMQRAEQLAKTNNLKEVSADMLQGVIR